MGGSKLKCWKLYQLTLPVSTSCCFCLLKEFPKVPAKFGLPLNHMACNFQPGSWEKNANLANYDLKYAGINFPVNK